MSEPAGQQPIQRVLIVEDEPAIRSSIAAALSGAGFDVLIVERADEALAAAPDFEPDAVLVEILLPGRQTQRVVQGLRASERFRDLPLVFITAQVAPHPSAHFEALAALNQLPGLFDPNTRSATTLSIWERWSAEHAAAS
jgi:two-component system, OmpR family, response regulator